MDNGGGNGAGCFEVEIWADTAKFTNVIVAGFRKRRVVYFRKLLFKSNKSSL